MLSEIQIYSETHVRVESVSHFDRARTLQLYNNNIWIGRVILLNIVWPYFVWPRTVWPSTVGRKPLCKFPFCRVLFGRIAYGRIPIGRISFGGLTFGRMPFGRIQYGSKQFGRICRLSEYHLAEFSLAIWRSIEWWFDECRLAEQCLAECRFLIVKNGLRKYMETTNVLLLFCI